MSVAPLPPEAEAEIKRVCAELRHAYTHLMNGAFEPKSLACGLISPQIARLERLTTVREAGDAVEGHS